MSPDSGRPASARPRRGGRDGGSRTPSVRPPLARRVLTWLGLTALGLLLLGAAAFVVGYLTTDIPDPNTDFTAQTTFVYYSDGKSEVGRFATQNRDSIPLSDVPQQVQDAVIAAEDRTFYTNKGVDPKGILRAAFSNVRGNPTQGASTITQQYVKIFYLSQERTLARKVKEAFVSLKLQRRQSKDEILQGYLNTIYFGRGAYGIEAASQAYFDKSAKRLSAAEGAVLASVLNSPTALDPAGGADARRSLLGRYQYVLDGMAAEGNISADQAARLRSRLPRFPRIESQDQYGGQRGHVLALVKRQLLAQGFSDQEISGGGLKITTTFTRNAMNAAARAVRDQAPKKLENLHVAVASVDPDTGALRGMYAGQDYLDSQINWALAGGAPGSAFKPFALAAGLADGYSLRSRFAGNSPYVFPDGTTRVVNEGPGEGNDYGSRISLLTATEQSVNTAYVDLTQSMRQGPRKVLDMAVRMGIPRSSAGLEPVAGISLGSATISPVDMANAYGTIADGGRAKKWFVITKVTDDSGRTRYEAPSARSRALRNDLARDVSYALQQVVSDGTGRNALALDRPAAGKTGTATNEAGNVSSSWFVGYTPQLATAVMYVRGDGNDNLSCVRPRSRGCEPGYLVPYFGAEFPTRTWTQAVRETLDDAPVEEFPPPANVEAERDDHAPLPSLTARPSATAEPSDPPTRAPREEPSDRPTSTPTRSSPPASTAPPPTSAPPSPPPSSAPPTGPPSGEPSPTGPTQPPSPTPTPTAGPGNGGGTNGNGNGSGTTGNGNGNENGNGALGRGSGVAAP